MLVEWRVSWFRNDRGGTAHNKYSPSRPLLWPFSPLSRTENERQKKQTGTRRLAGIYHSKWTRSEKYLYETEVALRNERILGQPHAQFR